MISFKYVCSLSFLTAVNTSLSLSLVKITSDPNNYTFFTFICNNVPKHFVFDEHNHQFFR